MRPEVMYANVTAKGAKEALGQIAFYDDDVTIGEIRKVLEARLPKAKDEEEAERQRLIDTFKGKCLRIKFSDTHKVILNIVDVEIINRFGLEALLIGDCISFYKDDITYRAFRDDEYASQFYPNQEEGEFPHEEYEIMAETYRKLERMMR